MYKNKHFSQYFNAVQVLHKIYNFFEKIKKIHSQRFFIIQFAPCITLNENMSLSLFHTMIGFSLPICWYSVLYILGAVIMDFVPGTIMKEKRVGNNFQ